MRNMPGAALRAGEWTIDHAPYLSKCWDVSKYGLMRQLDLQFLDVLVTVEQVECQRRAFGEPCSLRAAVFASISANTLPAATSTGSAINRTLSRKHFETNVPMVSAWLTAGFVPTIPRSTVVRKR